MIGNIRLVISMTTDLEVDRVGIPIYAVAKQRKGAISHIVSELLTVLQKEGDKSLTRDVCKAIREKDKVRLTKLFIENGLSNKISVNDFLNLVCDRYNKIDTPFVSLVNRQPTLWKHGLTAMFEQAHTGETLKIHPIYATAFNADNDGDEMAVYCLS